MAIYLSSIHYLHDIVQYFKKHQCSMNVKPECYFNFLCLNEKLSFCLIVYLQIILVTLSILDFMGFVLGDFVGKTNV